MDCARPPATEPASRTSQSVMPRCSRRQAAPRPVGPAPTMRCRTFTRGLAAVKNERITEGRVGLVVDRAPFGMRPEEFGKCACFSLARVAPIMEPVVKEQDRAVLEN